MPQTHHQIPLDPHMNQNPASPGCVVPPHGPPPRVSRSGQDTVTWHASRDFEIVNIRTDPPDATRPQNPFGLPLPFKAFSNGGVYRANSGPMVVSHDSKIHYRVTFKFKKNGQDEFRDPHFDGDI